MKSIKMKKINKLLSLAMTAALTTATFGVTGLAATESAWADVTDHVMVSGTEKTINDNVSVEDNDGGAAVTVKNGGSATINGDVTVTSNSGWFNASAVYVEDGTIAVNGDVTGAGSAAPYGVQTWQTESDDEATINISGDVQSSHVGAFLHTQTDNMEEDPDGSLIKLTIGGSMESRNEAINYRNYQSGRLDATVVGTVTSTQSNAIYLALDAGDTKLSTGSVSGDMNGLVMIRNAATDPANLTIVVDGDLAGESYSGASLQLGDTMHLNMLCTGTISGKNALAGGVSEDNEFQLITWGLLSAANQTLVNMNKIEGAIADTSAEAKAAMQTKVLDAIDYIIRRDASLGTIRVGGLTTTRAADGKLYTTAKRGATTITATVPDGYVLTSLTGKATVTDNGDGTYVLTVPDGGQVTLALAKKQIPADPVTPADEKGDAGQGIVNKPALNTAPGSKRVAPGASVEAVTARISTFDEDGVQYGKTLTATSYDNFNEQILAAIKDAPKKGKLVIATDTWDQMDASIAQELADRTDLELEIRYDDRDDKGSHFEKIAVPAGSAKDLQKLITKVDGRKIISFDKLAEKFSSEEIDCIYE